MLVFLSILLASSAYVVSIPNVHTAEMTVEEKGLSILNNVIGVDLSKYAITTIENQTGPKSSYLGVIPQENIMYNLTSEGSNLRMLYTFANGKLQMIQVVETEGSPSLIKPAPGVNYKEMARVFLSNYQTCTANPLYGELKSTLDNVDASKNLTKAVGNTILEMRSSAGGYTNFKWYYTSKGAIAPYSKFVALGFKDGFLAVFVDNWQFYNVGSTSVNLSEKEAISIALETAKAHSWSETLDENAFDANNFNESNVKWTSLIFDNSLRASNPRSEDALELYPVWRVGVALNKWYGELYGIQVDIWADTKEVRYVQEARSHFTPQQYQGPTSDTLAPIASTTTVSEVTSQISSENQENATAIQSVMAAGAGSTLMIWIMLSFLAASTGITVFWAARNKKTNSRNPLRLRSPRSLKTFGILLSLLVSVVFLASIATVNATTRAGVVWGAESTGQHPDVHPYVYWRKTAQEIYWQQSIAHAIASNFAENGYDAYNNQGSHGTTSVKSYILSQLQTLQGTHDYVAVVDFDHGLWRTDYVSGELHYMFEDDVGTIVRHPIGANNHWDQQVPGNAVYDMDIYPRTYPNLFFAFINACESARVVSSEYDYAQQRWWPAEQGIVNWWDPLNLWRARGLPYAFTHRLVRDKSLPGFNIWEHISDDGYNDPDDGSQAYIGFTYGAASLDQNVPYQSGSLYFYWVNWFFYQALSNDISVNAALDSASWNFYGTNFGNSPLQDFTSYWPGVGTGDHSKMVVYGNGRIHLKDYVPPSGVSTPSVSGPTSGVFGQTYEFGASSTDVHGHNIRYTFYWGDGTQTVTENTYPSGATAYASHSWNSPGYFSVTVKAQCDSGAWSYRSDPYTVNIGLPPGYHWLTIDTWDNYGGQPITDVWIDDVWVGTTPVAVPVTENWHKVEVDYDLGYWYLWGFSDGYGNGEYRPIYSDTLISAYYQAIW